MTIGDAPSAPAPGLVLYNSEEQSDLIFNVGPSNDGEVWRIPAHSFVIACASPVFAKLVDSGEKEIAINASPQDFQVLLSFIYKKEIHFESVANALRILNLSASFQLHELTKCCINHLRTRITVTNVLDILDGAFRNSITEGELMGPCLALLDRHADEIFSSVNVTCIERLDQQLLQSILKRDSLCLSSELLAFDAVNAWSSHQCLRTRLPVTGDNKRRILSSTLFTVRYLLMSREEFLRGPYTSDLLTEDEKSYLLGRITGNPLDNIPHSVAHLASYSLDTPRSSFHGSKMKKSASKKLLNGLSGFVICVIQLLD